MADIPALLAALDVFTRAPDRAAIEKANHWLQDFQHSVNTVSPMDLRRPPPNQFNLSTLSVGGLEHV